MLWYKYAYKVVSMSHLFLPLVLFTNDVDMKVNFPKLMGA